MSQKTLTSTTDITELLSFPKEGDIVSGVKIVGVQTKFMDGKFGYRIVLPKTTRRADIPNLLRTFHTTQLITIDNVDYVVENHDYQTKPTRTNTIVTGTLNLEPLSLTNPVQQKLTALQDFDQEYTKMEMAEPGSYFRVFPYRGFDGPTFRNKLFSFVSTMGENYGYCDDKKIYHRRASLVMPKIKITKAPEDAKMFYHTHPKKDEPSLSSADDYLLYFDMSHKPRNIRHFYTVMADRMDYFHIVPKHSKKKDYVKINEDKFIKSVDNQIEIAGKRMDEKTPNETYDDDLHYCEKVTREVVKHLNKKYDKYFTITYKCYYKVRKNPDKPTGSDLHLDDELIAKGLNDIKTGKYSWPEFDTKEKPHEDYAYWHSRYFSLNKNHDEMGYMGLLPGDMRRLEYFLYSPYRGSNYTYDDILGILCISHDIRIRDAKIRDGKRNDSRINDILDYLELDDQIIREDMIMFDSIVAADAYGDLAQETGTHQFILPLADFSMKSVEAMIDVKKGKRDFERSKYDIMVTLREKMAKAVAESLLEENEKIRKDIRGEEIDPETEQPVIIDPATTVPVYGQDGLVQKDRINPPVEYKKTEYKAHLPTKIFENSELLKEKFQKFEKEGTPLLNKNNMYTISIPVESTAVTMIIASRTGSVQFHYPGSGYQRTIEPNEAVVSAFRILIEELNSHGFEIPTDDIAIGTTEPIRNPNDGLVISISGPMQSTKDKVIAALEKRLDAGVVRTYTTGTLKDYEKKSNMVEVSEGFFNKMAANGALIVITSSLDGSRRGYLRDHFLKSRYTIVDANVADLPFLLKSDPAVMSFYLQPTNTEAEIKKLALEDVSPQEAERIAKKAIDRDADGEVDYLVEYDAEKPAGAIEEIFQSIPKKNPGIRGSVFVPKSRQHYLIARSWAQQNMLTNPPITDVPGVMKRSREQKKRGRFSPDQRIIRDWAGKQPQVGKAKSEHGHQFDGTISSGRKGAETRELLELTTKSKYFRKKYKKFLDIARVKGWVAALQEVLKSIPVKEWEARPRGWAGDIVTIDEIQTVDGGVCRHFATFGGLIVERAIKEGRMNAKVYYVRGPGHGWLVVQSGKTGKVYIIDRAQNIFEELTEDLVYTSSRFGDIKYSEYVYKDVPELAPLVQQNPPRKFKPRSPPYLTMIHDFDGEPDYLAFNFHHEDQDSIISHLGLQPVSKESITPGGTIPEGYKEDDFGYPPLAQVSDYVPIKTQDGLFPADAKIAPLIQHLLDSGLTLGGWSEADDLNPWGYVTFDWDHSRDLDEIKSALKGYPELTVAPHNTFNFEQDKEILKMMKPRRNPRIEKKNLPTKFDFVPGKEYTFDELPGYETGRMVTALEEEYGPLGTSLKEDALHHFRSKEEGGYGFPGSAQEATYRAVMIPNEKLVEKFGHLKGKQSLQKHTEKYGLDYPSIGNEGNNRRIAMAKLGRDMPHLEVVPARTNPGWRHGKQMEDDPFEDEFE